MSVKSKDRSSKSRSSKSSNRDWTTMQVTLQRRNEIGVLAKRHCISSRELLDIVIAVGIKEGMRRLPRAKGAAKDWSEHMARANKARMALAALAKINL